MTEIDYFNKLMEEMAGEPREYGGKEPGLPCTYAGEKPLNRNQQESLEWALKFMQDYERKHK